MQQYQQQMPDRFQYPLLLPLGDASEPADATDHASELSLRGAADPHSSAINPIAPTTVPSVNDQLESVRGEMTLAGLQLERARHILWYSARYRISPELATSIYDIAQSEGIDPALAFRLVKVESNFEHDARSHMNSIGLTQLQLATARFYDPGITEEDLHVPEVNLRIGFRYLRDMLRTFNYDMNLALLAYNRGPGRVQRILREGGDPANGYAKTVLRIPRPALN
jgi:soluble lytic murein transglycosylase-like protein